MVILNVAAIRNIGNVTITISEHIVIDPGEFFEVSEDLKDELVENYFKLLQEVQRGRAIILAGGSEPTEISSSSIQAVLNPRRERWIITEATESIALSYRPMADTVEVFMNRAEATDLVDIDTVGQSVTWNDVDNHPCDPAFYGEETLLIVIKYWSIDEWA